jgi:hypothetical protein
LFLSLFKKNQRPLALGNEEKTAEGVAGEVDVGGGVEEVEEPEGSERITGRCCRMSVSCDAHRPNMKSNVSIAYHIEGHSYCFAPSCSSTIPGKTGDRNRCQHVRLRRRF